MMLTLFRMSYGHKTPVLKQSNSSSTQCVRINGKRNGKMMHPIGPHSIQCICCYWVLTISDSPDTERKFRFRQKEKPNDLL